MAIFLVLGECEKSIFGRIEERTKEMLSSSQRRSIRFVALSQDTDAHAEVERIRRGLQAGDADSTVVHAFYVFDGGENEAEALRQRIQQLKSSLELDGTMERFFHLIWLIHETPQPRYDYAAIGKQFGIGLDAGTDELFNFVYLISDRRSDLIYDATDAGYVSGAALMISRVLLAGKVTRGIYAIGVGQRTISEHEIRKYTAAKLAGAIENSGLRHQNRMAEFCTKAFRFKEATASLGIYRYLTRQMINGEFCVIEGESKAISEIDDSFPELALEEFFENWRSQLIGMIQQTPFIGDVKRFFEENGGIREYCEEIEKELSRMSSAEARTVKLPVLPGRKRDVAASYNTFVSKRKEAQNAVFARFMQIWRTQIGMLDEPIRMLSAEWNYYLDHYKENDNFIKTCVSQAEPKTKAIDRTIASMTYEEAISESRDMTSRESWDWLMGRLVDAVMDDKDVRAIDLMAGVGKLPSDQLDTNVLQPIHRSTEAKLLCVSHGEQDVFGLPISTFFVPESLFRGGIDRDLPHYSFTEVTPAYQNIEAITLYPIAMDKYGMLTFIAQKPQQGETCSDRPAEAAEELALNPPVSVKTKTNHAVQDENPFGMSVSIPSYKLTLDWSQTEAASLLCRISSPGEQVRTITILRKQYEMQGTWDISQQIRKGLHTIELWSREKCESRIQIRGKAETVQMVLRDEKTFQYSDVNVYCQTLEVSSVDGEEENMLDNRLWENLYFTNGGSTMKMPRPSVRRKQYWDIYRVTDDIPDISAGKDFEGMYQIEVKSV